MMSSRSPNSQGFFRSRPIVGRILWVAALWFSATTSPYLLHAAPETGLLAHWRLSPEWKQGTDLKAVTGPSLSSIGVRSFTSDPKPGQLEFNPGDSGLLVAENPDKDLLPRKAMSLESWVRVDEPEAPGGILSYCDDREGMFRGWLLGVRDGRFFFALDAGDTAGSAGLKSPETAERRRWYHLAATFDGRVKQLYVNGVPVAASTNGLAEIRFPDAAPLLIGSVRSGAGSHTLQGALHEVLVYRRALASDEILERFQRRKAEFPAPAPAPPPLRLSFGPFAELKRPGSARIAWEANPGQQSRIVVEDGPDVLIQDAAPNSTGPRTTILTHLQPNREYHYRVVGPTDAGTTAQSHRYLLDTSFDYSPLPIPEVGQNPSNGQDQIREAAARILQRSGVRDGYCVLLGAGDPRLALELVRQSQLQVVVLDHNENRIAAARTLLDQGGAYGVRASVHRIASGPLPYGDYFANLVVSGSPLTSSRPPETAAGEVFRILRPEGGTLLLGELNASTRAEWERWHLMEPKANDIQPTGEGAWMQFRRPRLAGAGEWSHQYGSADNTATSMDDLVGGDLQVAWWGDPGPRPMPDRGNRNPAPLSVQGRLFIQGNRILFGLDAYNGTILWTLSAPEVRRANVTRDCSNMAAAGNHLYVVQGRWLLNFDGQSGTVLRRHPADGDGSTGAFDWGYVAAIGDRVIGSRQKQDAAYLGDDGEWYEDFDDQQTSRVTSDRLFSLDPETGARPWTYAGGVILNSTLTIADGMILFLESRNPKALAAAGSRLTHEQLTDQYLVALDLKTGQKLWEKGHDFSDCQYMTYLVYNQGTAIVTGTDREKKFHTFAFSAPAPGLSGGDDLEKSIPGRLLWSDTHKEDKGHHSGHLQHPLVLDQVFYSDQRAFDLRSGKLLRMDLPERRGCGIMSASHRAVFFRHHYQGVWDLATNRRSQFEGIRTGCWLGMIPAGGMLLAPESSAGCSCTHAIQISVAYAPKPAPPR
ncbi:MAG: PQQ-binding-like beta-propeller repeat protein [Verrucomicrobiales bacterium]|nr:PQQ-binding-like beta-propeller repeat protein [Verrucomicrobiales bacterium]